jgi:hypothetical protein
VVLGLEEFVVELDLMETYLLALLQEFVKLEAKFQVQL